VLLWIVAVVVGILFAVAIWKASRSSAPRSKPRPAPPAAEEATGFSPGLSIPARIAASRTKQRTAPASVARRHRGTSPLGGELMRPVLHVPNSGRRAES
jgi:hypothetical protein